MALYEEIRRLLDLVEGAAVSELTLESDGRRITIKKPAAPRAAAMDEPASSDALPVIPPADFELEQLSAHTATIAAPMVGVFRHAEPPVGPGMRVEAGQVVGIIESMKLMNDVRADEAGTVRDVLAEAGIAVEYGQPLFELDVDEPAYGI